MDAAIGGQLELRARVKAETNVQTAVVVSGRRDGHHVLHQLFQTPGFSPGPFSPGPPETESGSLRPSSSSETVRRGYTTHESRVVYV